MLSRTAAWPTIVVWRTYATNLKNWADGRMCRSKRSRFGGPAAVAGGGAGEKRVGIESGESDRGWSEVVVVVVADSRCWAASAAWACIACSNGDTDGDASETGESEAVYVPGDDGANQVYEIISAARGEQARGGRKLGVSTSERPAAGRRYRQAPVIGREWKSSSPANVASSACMSPLGGRGAMAGGDGSGIARRRRWR